MTVIEARRQLIFWREVRLEYEKAYLALIKSNIKYYMIDDRQLTRYDLSEIMAMMDRAQQKIDELEAIVDGKKQRKAFGVIPRDW